MKKTLFIGIIAVGLSGCASHSPVLYPNDEFQSQGQAAAYSAVEECKQLAEQAGSQPGNGAWTQTLISSAQGAAAGAVTGAVGGAISGNVGLGTLIGAATGATAGIVSAVFYSNNNINPVYVQFVNRCLQEKGYEVAGWE
jgi:anti-sigma factor RsiW